MLKWQLLAELLDCSKKIVAVRSSCGTINDARLQCLEALKVAVKLQSPTLYVFISFILILYSFYRILAVKLCRINSVVILKFGS